tara:strand:- start:716 stop:988 length:273 start_codon:yes stop_codon:yes gene_type:complete
MNTDEFVKKLQSMKNLAEMEINRVVAEVEKLTVFRDRVLAAFHEMPRNKRSLTYLLDELGYLNHFPEGLGLYELTFWSMERAQQYIDEEE